MMGKDEHKGLISEYPTPSYSVNEQSFTHKKIKKKKFRL